MKYLACEVQLELSPTAVCIGFFLLLQPYEDNRNKSVGTACLCGGKITVFVKLNRTGFIPGEDLRLNADVSTRVPTASTQNYLTKIFQ